MVTADTHASAARMAHTCPLPRLRGVRRARVATMPKDSGASTPVQASSLSAGDQLARMETTGALLNELFQCVVEQQQRQGRQPRVGGHDGHTEKAELTTEVVAKISEAINY